MAYLVFWNTLKMFAFLFFLVFNPKRISTARLVYPEWIHTLLYQFELFGRHGVTAPLDDEQVALITLNRCVAQILWRAARDSGPEWLWYKFEWVEY